MDNEKKGKSLHLGVNTLFHVPGDVGGTEVYLRELLLAIVQEFPNMPITLFTHLDNDSVMREIFAGKVNVHFERLAFRASVRPLRIILEQLWMPMRVLRSRVNVLWSPGYTTPFWAGCPQVVTIHDLQYKSYPEDLTYLERMTLDLLVRVACRVSQQIICVSEFSKSELVRHRFATPEKIAAILEGVDPSFGEEVKDQEAVREMYKVVPPDKKYILCVAHTYPHKNVHMLVEAFHLIKDKIPHDLVLVGKPRRGEKLLQECLHQDGPNQRIHRFAEGVTYKALKLLYKQADLFVLPSLYEGFGLPVLEAMMSGTPVITSANASLAEVGGDYAFYSKMINGSELAGKIIEVLACSEKERSDLVCHAQKWAGNFLWERAAHQTVKVLKSSLQ